MRFFKSAAATAVLAGVVAIFSHGPAQASSATGLASTGKFIQDASEQNLFNGYAVEEVRHRERRYRRRHHRRRHRDRYHGPNFGIQLYIPVVPPRVYYPVYPRPYGYSCSYWQARCAANWSTYNDIRGCLRYHGC